jgi:alanine racemase
MSKLLSYLLEKHIILGRISMNITVIDVSRTGCQTGDAVIIYSDKPEDRNSVTKTAKICRTIPDEILVHLHPSIKLIVR